MNPLPTPAPAPELQPPVAPATEGWSPRSWIHKPNTHAIDYPDAAALASATRSLEQLPPLVTSWEVERLRTLIAEAQEGRRFLLQGGDCAETFADCRPALITSKLKILLQMSLVLAHGAGRPVIRVARLAGQFAKPRTSAIEARRDATGRTATLPSYFGDLVNAAPFTLEARTPDPARLLEGYHHAAMTLNFVRSLVAGGFADLHHPEYWDLAFFGSAALSPERRAQYQQMARTLAEGLRLMETLGERSLRELARSEVFVSHEALNLWYDCAQTRAVPRREGVYNLAAHLPWVGHRTRTLGHAHIEYLRGIRNPVGVKVGPDMTPSTLLDLINVLNPANEPGRLVLIARLGASKVASLLPPLVQAAASASRRVLWVCDPMHANTRATDAGVKTRYFSDIQSELEQSCDLHARAGVPLGGVHLELTGEDVTECMGGARNVTEQDLSTNYASLCDPRLNYQQALELAFMLAQRLGTATA